MFSKEGEERRSPQTWSTAALGKRPVCSLEEARCLLKSLKTSFRALPPELRSGVVEELSCMTLAYRDDYEVPARQPVLGEPISPRCLLGVPAA
jgi:hypothetical protein